MHWDRPKWGIEIGFVIVLLAGCNSTNESDERSAALPVPRQPNDPIAVLVSEREHYFGSARFGDTGSHRFVVRNDGKSPLEIWPAKTDQESVAGRVEGSPIPPGGSGALVVDWKLQNYQEQYLENIDFETNDPGDPKISVRVMGRVPPPYMPSVARIGVRNVKASEGFEESFDIYAYLSKDIKITGFQWLNPATAEFIKVEAEPLPADHEALVADPDIVAGVRIWVRAQPGMPSGILREALTVTTEQESPRPIQVAVIADVRGALSIEAGKGASYDSEQNVVDLGRINRLAKQDAMIHVIANTAELGTGNFQLSVTSTDPEDVLRAEIQESREVGNTQVFPVQLTLQGNGQSLSRLGPSPELLGEVVLSTNDAKQPALRFYVKFAITQ